METAIPRGTGGEGELSVDQLVVLVRRLERTIHELRRENERLKQQLKERDGQNPTQRLDEEYSLKAEEQRSRGKRRKKQKSPRRGRRSTEEKLAEVDRHEDVFQLGAAAEDCSLHYSRPVLRIEHGRAVRVAYHVYRSPRGEIPTIPGTLGRSEYGIEISVSLAFMVFILRLSMDKVCRQLEFFWGLKLSKSQADALLKQLARAWEPEFDMLCTLLAGSAVVHADKTSWSINSVWAFLSEKAQVLLFGVHKDAATLATLLSKDLFNGVVVSDDAAVYRGFSRAQKCWAHLLRKAIKLTLLQPDNEEYRTFLTGLLELYRKARRLQQDRRLKQTTRRQKVLGLEDDLWVLCHLRFKDATPTATQAERDFLNLVHELLRLMEDEELFTFVIHPQVPGTNNEAERGLRDAANDRKTGRTSKTIRGARRRTVLTSVLESLRQSLPDFTLRRVLAEVTLWPSSGCSCFRQLLNCHNLPPPASSLLDVLLPPPGAA